MQSLSFQLANGPSLFSAEGFVGLIFLVTIGVIIVGLASVIVGMSLFPAKTIVQATIACIMGAVLYRLAVALALNADFLGFRASDVQMVTGVLVALALIGQKSGGSIARLFRKGRNR